VKLIAMVLIFGLSGCSFSSLIPYHPVEVGDIKWHSPSSLRFVNCPIVSGVYSFIPNNKSRQNFLIHNIFEGSGSVVDKYYFLPMDEVDRILSGNVDLYISIDSSDDVFEKTIYSVDYGELYRKKVFLRQNVIQDRFSGSGCYDGKYIDRVVYSRSGGEGASLSRFSQEVHVSIDVNGNLVVDVFTGDYKHFVSPEFSSARFIFSKQNFLGI